MLQSVTIDIKISLKNLAYHLKKYNFFEEIIAQATKLAADLEVGQDFPEIYTTR